MVGNAVYGFRAVVHLAALVTLVGCATTAQPVVSQEYPGSLVLPEAGDVWPGPETFTIGNAIAPINYWMTAWTVNDMIKMAGFERDIGDPRPSPMWMPVVEGQWSRELIDLVDTDEEGWLRSMVLTDGRRAGAYASIIMGGSEIPGTFPAGDYALTYDGTGEIEVDGAEIVDAAPGRMTVRYDGNGTVILYITETDPAGTGDYIRNITMMRPDAVPGERFNRTYIDYLRPYSVIRPLHFVGDQLTYGTEITWAERKPEDYSHWGGALGAPYEVAIDLANESASALWLNIPIAVDDAFVRELARLTHERLDDSRRLYIEYGNELWNFSFPYELGRRYVLQRAQERWPGVLGSTRAYADGDPVHENMMIFSYQGARTAEIARIFEEEWGSERNRLVVVLAGQIGGSSPFWAPSRDLLDCPVYVGEEGAPPCAEAADAFAVAPYVGEYPGEVEFDRSSPEAFIAGAIDYVRGEGRFGENAAEPGLRYQIRSDVALAAEYDLPLIAYEGGQHFVGSRFTRDVVSTHPMMRELYDALFTVWQQEGGGLFVHYAGIIPRGQSEPGEEPGYFESENFGIKELQRQSRAEAPKWDAVLEEMVEAGQLLRR